MLRAVLAFLVGLLLIRHGYWFLTHENLTTDAFWRLTFSLAIALALLTGIRLYMWSKNTRNGKIDLED